MRSRICYWQDMMDMDYPSLIIGLCDYLKTNMSKNYEFKTTDGWPAGPFILYASPWRHVFDSFILRPSVETCLFRLYTGWQVVLRGATLVASVILADLISKLALVSTPLWVHPWNGWRKLVNFAASVLPMPSNLIGTVVISSCFPFT